MTVCADTENLHVIQPSKKMLSVLRCGASLLLISIFLDPCTANGNNLKALSPERSHLSLLSETNDLKRSLSPDVNDLKQSLSPDVSDLKRSMSADTNDLKRSISPDTSDLKQSLSPDVSYLKRSLSPAVSDLKRSLSPDVSDLKRNPHSDPSQLSLSRDQASSGRSSSDPLSVLLNRGLRTAESSRDSAVEKAHGKVEERADGSTRPAQRQKRDHLEDEEGEEVTSNKLTMMMHRQTLDLMSLLDTVTELDKKAGEVIQKPDKNALSAGVQARVEALMTRLNTTRHSMQQMQIGLVKRDLPEQPAVPRHTQGREPAAVAENSKTARDQAKQDDPLQQQVDQLQQQVRELHELMTAMLQHTETLHNLQEDPTTR